MSEQRYYVFSFEDVDKGRMGGCIVWWRDGGHGYTNRLEDAGIFTDENKAKNYPPIKHCVYVPVDEVKKAAKTTTHVWADDLPKPLGWGAAAKIQDYWKAQAKLLKHIQRLRKRSA